MKTEKNTHTKQEQNENTLKYTSYCSEVKERYEMFYYWNGGYYVCGGCGERVNLKKKRFNYVGYKPKHKKINKQKEV